MLTSALVLVVVVVLLVLGVLVVVGVVLLWFVVLGFGCSTSHPILYMLLPITENVLQWSDP